MPFIETFKKMIGWDKQKLSYVIATVQLPWSIDKVKEIVPYWATHQFVSIAKDPKMKSILLRDLKWGEDALETAIKFADIQFFKHFPLVGFLTKKDQIEELRHIYFIDYVYEVPEDTYDYLNIVKGLHYVLEYNESEKHPIISVVNMSLQPLEPYPFNRKEAINVATCILTKNQISVVVAAGNFGERGNNSLNPWSVAPWIISVGATYSDGKRLWEKSSRGIPNDPLYRPTVVAPGVDVIVPSISEDVHGVIDAEGKYSTATGTSFAAAHVFGIVNLCMQFINDYLRKSPIIPEWQLAVESQFGARVKDIAPSPDVIKNMVEDMAVEMLGYGTHEVGAGFVNVDIAAKYFANFKLSNFIKVFSFV